MNKQNQKLAEKLEILKLSFIAESFTEAASHAGRKKLDYIAFLENLVDGEVALKQQRSITNRIKKAKFSCIKTLEQFNWSHPSKINRIQIQNLFRLNFVDEKKNIILLGNCGLGKSHLAVALAHKTCNKGYSTLFTPAVDIINNLSAAVAVNSLDKAIKKYILQEFWLLTNSDICQLINRERIYCSRLYQKDMKQDQSFSPAIEHLKTGQKSSIMIAQ